MSSKLAQEIATALLSTGGSGADQGTRLAIKKETERGEIDLGGRIREAVEWEVDGVLSRWRARLSEVLKELPR